MSPSATPHMVELPNSVHQLPTGSKAMRRTNGQRWIELTLGVKRSADLPDLSDLDKKLPKDRKYMTRDQLASIGLQAKVGITPMIGVNDVKCENFTVANAQQVTSFSQSNTFVRTLGFWAIGADPNRSYLNVFKAFH